MFFSPEQEGAKLVQWLKEEVKKAGKGVVFGLSGGVDSAVVAALAQRAFPTQCLALILPCYSNPQDITDAQEVATLFQIPFKVISLDTVFNQLVFLFTGKNYQAEQSLPLANLKPRLRMLTLYYFANLYSYLVLGTGNKSELTVGYFTKYGDGGVDLLPLGNLVKSQVRELAAYLGVPAKIIHKPPSAGLWEGQTDEAEMGLSYAELDAFLIGKEVKPGVAAKIKKMEEQSKHKRQLPAIPT